LTKFKADNVYMTRGIAEMIAADSGFEQFVHKSLDRHFSGDWGDVDEADAEANDHALTEGERILSAYMLNDIKIWVITEGDRSSCTVLFPNEY
jgi:hypothetical protein